MSGMYDELALYYDDEYGLKSDDLDFYLNIVKQYGSPVLEIGVGTGRLALHLARFRYTVDGIDSSNRMLDKLKEKQTTGSKLLQKYVHSYHMDMRSFDLQRQYPVCIIPFRTFLHNLTLDDQLSTLYCIHRHLKPNGVLAFDIFVPLYSVIAQTEWRSDVDERELKKGLSVKTLIEHNPREQLLSVKNTYTEDNPSHTQTSGYTYRYIFRYEMESLLRLAGFNVLNVFNGFDRKDYDYFSGLAVFIAQKN